MVYVIINGKYEIPLIGALSPLNFMYGLLNYRNSQFEGEVYLNRLKCDSKEILNNLNSIESISLVNEEGLKVDIDGIVNVNSKLENGDLSISIKVSDVFTIYDRIMWLLSKTYDCTSRPYDCYSTSMKCNLSCEYCLFGCTPDEINIKHHPRSNFLLGEYFIKKIKDITVKHINSNERSIRLMGGETLLDLDDFVETFKFAVKLNDKDMLDDVWIYTNYTINVDKFLEIVDNLILKHTKHLTIVATTDSYDSKCSIRIKDENMLSRVYDNIKKTCDKYKDNKSVSVVSNIMHTTVEASLNNIMKLHELGITYIQMSYDEFSLKDKALNELIPEIRFVYKRMEEMGIKRLKQNLGKTMWVHFSIEDGDHEIFRSKYSVKSDTDVLSFQNDY